MSLRLAFLLHAWDADGSACTTSWTTTGAGSTARTTATMSVGRPGRSGRSSPTSRTRGGRPSLWLLDRAAARPGGGALPREVAYAVLGLTRAGISMLPASLRSLLELSPTGFRCWYDKNRRDDWRWFETEPDLRQRPAAAGADRCRARLGDRELPGRGLEALDWYADQCTVDGDVIRLVGNRWRACADEPTPPD